MVQMTKLTIKLVPKMVKLAFFAVFGMADSSLAICYNENSHNAVFFQMRGGYLVFAQLVQKLELTILTTRNPILKAGYH